MNNRIKPRVSPINPAVSARIKSDEGERREAIPPYVGQPERLITLGQGEVLVRGFSGVYYPLITRRFALADVTTFIIESEEVPQGRMWIVTSAAVLNESNGYTAAQWFVGKMGYNHYIDQTTTIAVGVVTPYRYPPIYLMEGKSLAARLTGVTVNDKITLFLNGVEIVAR